MTETLWTTMTIDGQHYAVPVQVTTPDARETTTANQSGKESGCGRAIVWGDN